MYSSESVGWNLLKCWYLLQWIYSNTLPKNKKIKRADQSVWYPLKEVLWSLPGYLTLFPPKNKTDHHIWFSNLLTLNEPNEGYFRNVLCALNLISTFLFITDILVNDVNFPPLMSVSIWWNLQLLNNVIINKLIWCV